LCGSALENIERKLKLGLFEFQKDGNLFWSLPNAGNIWLTGCSDRLECEKFRGDARSEVAIDEADSLRAYLEYLALDCIEPSLLDLHGPLVLGGTPGPTLAGYFHRASTDNDLHWSRHHWTCLENPHLTNAAKWIEIKQAEMSRARYAREILGIWESDAESLIFNYDPNKNSINPNVMPAGDRLGHPWKTLLSVDVGFNHPVAWCVWRWLPGCPEIYLIKAIKQSGLTPSRAGALTQQYKEQYGATRVIADTGGIGKGYAEEWAQRYGLTVERATKHGRGEALATFSGEVKSGQVKIESTGCRPLLDEWATLTWDDQGDDSQDGLPDDCTDAALYGFRAIRPTYKPEFELSPEQLAEQQARASKEAAKKRAAKQARIRPH
jgi:hypothetical protein